MKLGSLWVFLYQQGVFIYLRVCFAIITLFQFLNSAVVLTRFREIFSNASLLSDSLNSICLFLNDSVDSFRPRAFNVYATSVLLD